MQGTKTQWGSSVVMQEICLWKFPLGLEELDKAAKTVFWKGVIHVCLKFPLPKCYTAVSSVLVAETLNTPQQLCEGITSEVKQNKT